MSVRPSPQLVRRIRIVAGFLTKLRYPTQISDHLLCTSARVADLKSDIQVTRLVNDRGLLLHRRHLVVSSVHVSPILSGKYTCNDQSTSYLSQAWDQMKFHQGWQVNVVRPNAGAYADIAHGSDKYVVGIPGQPFEVKVTAPPSMFSSFPLLRVNLTVEGQSSGSCVTLRANRQTASFRGFISTIKGKHVESRFLFGAAETDLDAPAIAPGVTKTGGLEIKIEHVQLLPGQRAPPAFVSSQAAAAPKAIEGKKWFLQPSLSAKAGAVIDGPPITFSTNVYQSRGVLATLNLKMETAAILVLRKVLDPENPSHQRIIDSSQPPEEQEEGEGESAAATAGAASASNPNGGALSPRGTKRRIKAETTQSNKAVKAEPNQASGNGNFGESAVIDLT